jgi:hypothetical protein
VPAAVADGDSFGDVAWSDPSAERGGLFVDTAILHDDEEVSFRISNQAQLLQRVAVNQQEISQRALLDDAECPWLWIARSGECEQLGIGTRGHC